MTVIPAATVILVRDGERGLEVFLVKRHGKASFMSSAFVFPGGKVDPADGGAEIAAIRELYEEAGILLVEPLPDPERTIAERARLLADELSFPELLVRGRLVPAVHRLHWWARWVTPVQEPRRFDAEFFVAELPAGQSPSFDRKETVEELWITPADAIERQATGHLRLAPPQLRTFHELAAAGRTVADVVAVARARQEARAAICPQLVSDDGGLSIVLPWDPGYRESQPIPAGHLLATPPSRFVWNGSAWRAQ